MQIRLGWSKAVRGVIAGAMEQSQLKFLKMHGAGNDFVIFDARAVAVRITPALAQAIGHRHFGVGFDQLAIIHADQGVEARLEFYNSDGSISATCGNATRCIASKLLDETGKNEITLRTERGDLSCRRRADGLTEVNMGQPIFEWDAIPLAQDVDTLHLPIDGDPAAVSMGNPHMSFVVDDAEKVDLKARGASLEHHPLYPERTNVEFLSLLGPDTIRMRIWERGAGITLASGSGSCAAAITAARRGLTGRKVKGQVDGGMIEINWTDSGVWMTGPVQLVFEGYLAVEFLEQV